MRDNRPLSPRLSIYRWHVAMLVSLLHRASGIFLVVCLPLYFWSLAGMTSDENGFHQWQQRLQTPLGRLILWLALSALIYHLLNGIRFLLLDAGVGETRDAMRMSAKFVLAIAFLSSFVTGVFLWI